MQNHSSDCDFRTVTDPAFAMTVYGITLAAAFGSMMLLALLALAVTFPFFLLLEGVIFFCALITVPTILYSSTHFTFTFSGDTLVITGRHPRQTVTVQNLTADAFILTQSASEERKNCGSLKIRELYLHIYGIREFDQFKRYIETHF